MNLKYICIVCQSWGVILDESLSWREKYDAAIASDRTVCHVCNGTGESDISGDEYIKLRDRHQARLEACRSASSELKSLYTL